MATRTPIELAHLLRCPLRALKATWAQVQHKRDMFAVVDMASHWPVVTPLYSGLEQALKVLAAHSLGVSVEVATAKGGILRGHGHDLGAIWKHIAPEAQATLEEHWQQFTSLHDYLLTGEAAKDGLATAEGFLRHLSGEKGQGYENWRYCLIQMQEVPKVSTEGMLQLWESVVDVYDACARPERKRPVRGPLEWVELRVHQAWEHARFQACIQIQEGARRKEYDIEEMGRSEIAWIRRRGGYANAAEQILWHRERGLRSEDEPERFEARETLRIVGGCAGRPAGEDGGRKPAGMGRQSTARRGQYRKSQGPGTGPDAQRGRDTVRNGGVSRYRQEARSWSWTPTRSTWR